MDTPDVIQSFFSKYQVPGVAQGLIIAISTAALKYTIDYFAGPGGNSLEYAAFIVVGANLLLRSFQVHQDRIGSNARQMLSPSNHRASTLRRILLGD